MAVLAPAAEPVVRTDLAALQGAWVTAAGSREARFLIVGHRFTFEFVDGAIYMGTFDLAPGQMDMHIEAGPSKHIGCWTRCIYKFEGGVLMWCAGKPDSTQRPTTFDPGDDRRFLSLVFQRAGRGTGR
jgi:uncharacterized protein (TIGR03067 family)